MAIWANMNADGVLETRTDSGDSLTKKSKNKNEVDSDMFLTLLVAEMQNQDPLEPTSNTEWVSQYATFTQVQKMSEMADSMDQLRANDLIGKEVIMKVTNSSNGETSYKRGVVEYTLNESGKSILVIDGQKYDLSDLDTVMSEEYSKAYDLYSEWTAKLGALPSLKFIDDKYETAIQELYDDFNNMTDYQKDFMKTYAAPELSLFAQYIDRLKMYGVEIKETEAKKETTLDDIMAAFGNKMDAILEKLNKLVPEEESEEGSEGE